MSRIDWDLWEVNKEQRKIFGCGYASNPVDRQPEVINSKVYQKWSNIMFRCKSVLRENYTRMDFSMCKEWLDFSKFKEFYEKNCYELEREDVNLYVNLLDFSNTEYSPEKAVFAPNTIGSLLNDSSKYSRESKRYNLPKWVREDVIKGRKYGYSGQIYFAYKDGEKKKITVLQKSNPYDAFYICKFIKELSFIHVAYQYKDVIATKLFESIIKYRVNEEGYYYIIPVNLPVFLYGIGFIKVEDFYKVTIEELKSESFKIWENIIYEAYKGISDVCEEWKDYYVFKKWYCDSIKNNMSKTNKIFNVLYDKNNVLYSPNTTVLLPHNLYILVYKQQKNGYNDRVPRGINKIYKKTKITYKIVPPTVMQKGDDYYVKLTTQKSYDTLEDAQIGYKVFRQKYKEKYLKDGGYENLIDPKLYQALLDYEIDIPTVDFEEDENGEENE